MSTKNKTKRQFPRLIAQELHDEWRSFVRSGDSVKLAELLGVSKPTIDKALIYGHAHKQSLIDGITKFFSDRFKRERDEAKKMSYLKYS